MAISDKISEAQLEPGLGSALELANKKLEEDAVGYQVSVVAGKELSAKEPVFLEIVRDGKKTPIGITHFARLTKNFETAPFEETARTIGELAESILKAIKIHEEAKSSPEIICTSVGTPFFKDQLSIEIRDGILFIEGVQITIKGAPLEAKKLCGEEGLHFVRAENGDFEAANSVDQREGKGIFFNKDSGEVYRK